jgi:hypothetical protein
MSICERIIRNLSILGRAVRQSVLLRRVCCPLMTPGPERPRSELG